LFAETTEKELTVLELFFEDVEHFVDEDCFRMGDVYRLLGCKVNCM
jgi:hypothetical protein